LNVEFIKTQNYYINLLIVEYLPGLWNSLVNALTFLLIDKLSLFRNYTEYVSKEKFILRVSFFYLTVNVILVPLATITGDKDLLTLAQEFTEWRPISRTFMLSNSSLFYITIFLQASSLGFLNVLLRLTDMLNEGLSLVNVDKFYEGVRNRPWSKRETHIFQYGYYYAYSVDLINVVAIYGTYTPILYPLCLFFLCMKSLCDGVTFICIYGKDIQGNGKLFESALRKVHLGLIYGHIMLAIQCYWEKKMGSLIANLVVIAVSGVVQGMLKGLGVADFKNMIKVLQGFEYSSPTVNDKADWVYKFTHPFVRNTPYVKEYIEAHNQPLPVPPTALKVEDENARKRFEIKLNQPPDASLPQSPHVRQMLSVQFQGVKLTAEELMHPGEGGIHELMIPSPPRHSHHHHLLGFSADSTQSRHAQQVARVDIHNKVLSPSPPPKKFLMKELSFESLRSVEGQGPEGDLAQISIYSQGEGEATPLPPTAPLT
jgi:hypothetical protein